MSRRRKAKVGKGSYGVKKEGPPVEEIIGWISEVTGTDVNVDKWDEDLKDGLILAELANKIKPGSIKKVNKSRIAFMQMENVSGFCRFCKAVGVPEQDCFSTVDLYQAGNLDQVLMCLESLSRVSRNVPSFSGPYVGAKISDKNVRDKSKFSKGEGSGLTLLEAKQKEVAEKNVSFDRVRHNIVKVSDEERKLYKRDFKDHEY